MKKWKISWKYLIQLKTIKNQAKEQKGKFLGMLLGSLGAGLLRSLLTSKGVIRAGENF